MVLPSVQVLRGIEVMVKLHVVVIVNWQNTYDVSSCYSSSVDTTDEFLGIR